MYQASAGDNIFSIAVKNTPHTIFAGTRNGVIRSTDNGTTFGYSNSGIPDSAWVYDIAIDSSGTLAIASSKGVFISTDNGDNWLTTTGIPPEDTVATLLFVNDTTSTGLLNKTNSIRQNSSRLYAGTKSGNFLVSELLEGYLFFHLLIALIPGNEQIASLVAASLGGLKLYAGTRSQISESASKINDVGGVYESTDNGKNWQQINDGLPSEPPVSALAIRVSDETFAELYAGLFKDTTFGAEIYKLAITTDAKEVSDQIPSDYKLEQNYPNPFNSTTTIKFALPKESFTKLEIFNSLGEKVSTLVSETFQAGIYEYEWNAEGLPSGIFFYRLTAENYIQVKKLLFMK
ncbi:MAG: T9SS type A sorting domain-containing protein [Ignavibacteria bacterium]|nr:T9SS type A sorting domain-containing protein [Ignavibacteria bacterium]